VSDVRALLKGRAVKVGDAAYLERLEEPPHVVEEWLRALVARFAVGKGRRDGALVAAVNAIEPELLVLDDDQLRVRIHAVACRMQREGLLDALIAEAFAIIREASRRVLGKRHHDVQLLAGEALLRGRIAEMATGEGKTLAATLGVCVAALCGAAVHVVTVNDYLAERDAEENQPLYAFFGLAVGVVLQDMDVDKRRAEYAKPVVYVSNKELTFDYLKDRIALGATPLAQLRLRRLLGARSSALPILRGLHVAIVDEADSVLIDEARTPLIISETLPDELDPAIYHRAIAFAATLSAGEHYVLGRERDIWLTSAGEAHAEHVLRDEGGVWVSALWRRELINKALSARELFHRDQHYIVADEKVQIVDEFTGRVMPDRTWERGLHQMIEAKEGCEISGQRRTLSQITYQRFFGRYLLLAGMTGTAAEVGGELRRVYDLSITRIPTNKALRRVRLPDRVFRNSDARWDAVAVRAAAVAAEGRAVLVGTRSVEASELLSAALSAQGVEHTVLNARQDAAEADAVAAAGQPGRITVATNMAGRGTDIKLAPEVEQRGGLHVILTEFHESARVDRQLFGRSARQGNPGSVEAIVSLDDELFVRYCPVLVRTLGPLCRRRFAWSGHVFRALVWFAQSTAERRNRAVRLDTIKRDRKWLKALSFVGVDKK